MLDMIRTQRVVDLTALLLIASLPLVRSASALQTADATMEWRHHGGDPQETRYAPANEVTPENVAELTVAWSWEIPKTGARIETTPIVVDGVLYGTGAMSFVFALDATTGREVWTWDPAIPHEEAGGPRTCCGDVNRGVAVDGEKLFVGLLDGRLVALNRSDGSVAWTVQTTPAGSDYTVTGAPRVVNGAVVIGNAGAEYGGARLRKCLRWRERRDALAHPYRTRRPFARLRKRGDGKGRRHMDGGVVGHRRWRNGLGRHGP